MKKDNDITSLNMQKIPPLRALFFLIGIILSSIFALSSPVWAGDAILSWDPNSETDLAGYKVYHRLATGNFGVPIDVGNQTTYTVTGLGDGTYHFAITAYDTSGNESPKSTEVSKTVLEEAGGGGSGPANNSNSTLTSGGCGFFKNSKTVEKAPIDIALFLVPIWLSFRMLFFNFHQKGNFLG